MFWLSKSSTNSTASVPCTIIDKVSKTNKKNKHVSTTYKQHIGWRHQIPSLKLTPMVGKWTPFLGRLGGLCSEVKLAGFVSGVSGNWFVWNKSKAQWVLLQDVSSVTLNDHISWLEYPPFLIGKYIHRLHPGPFPHFSSLPASQPC